MLLKEICTPEVVYCSPQTTVLAAARLMRQKHVGDLVVVEDPAADQVPLGIVTDRDIVIEVLGKELDASAITVQQIMHAPVVVARASEDVSQVIERMKAQGVRRVPVMGDDRKLAGIVSLDDLLKQLADDVGGLVELIAREQKREQHMRR